MSDQFLALRLFVRIAHARSFSRAARDLQLSQPSASRIVADLEAELGAALFIRTTRTVLLTEAGAHYLEKVQGILDALEEANHAVRGDGDLGGTLRLAMGSTLAVRAVAPRLQGFMTLHPRLAIDLVVEDRFQDLIADGVDLAFRFGDLPDSNATTRRIVSWPCIIAAAPSYLAQRGTPVLPADIADHDTIALGTAGRTPWTFRRNGEATSVPAGGRFATTTSEAAIAACVNGLGLFRTHRRACQRELETGQLVTVLDDWDAGTLDLHAIYSAGRAVKPAARAFAEHMQRHLNLDQARCS